MMSANIMKSIVKFGFKIPNVFSFRWINKKYKQFLLQVFCLYACLDFIGRKSVRITVKTPNP